MDDGAPLSPRVPGLPLLGNALSMAGDVQQYLVECYRRYGPIYRVRALSRSFTIMAGIPANQFLASQGDDLFSSEITMGGLAEEFHMRVHVLSGGPHRHLRRTLAPGLAPDLLAGRWDDFVAVTEEYLRRWESCRTLSVVDQFQRLTADQLSMVLTGSTLGPRFARFRFAFELTLDVTLTGKWPRTALSIPAYRRARAEILEFARTAVETRAREGRSEQSDLLDLAFDAVDEAGDTYPLDTRAGMALQGYFAGINTVAYLCSFMLFTLLKYPHILERIRAEVDAAFEGEGFTFEKIRTMRSMQGLVLETLRMHPSAPGSSRTVTRPFEFNGCRVDEGTHVLVATTVPHHLEEHFPDPHTINLDRDFKEARRSGAYAPFSVGAHKCPGAGMTEVLAAATMAYVVRNLDLELPSPDYTVRTKATPGPNPGRGFKVATRTRPRSSTLTGARPAST